MGKNKDGKNPLYKGEAGICKGCNENQPSILRHINKTKNKTCSKFYTDNDYDDTVKGAPFLSIAQTANAYLNFDNSSLYKCPKPSLASV